MWTEFNQRGDQLAGPCPVHGEPKKEKHFGIKLSTGQFNCFYCKAKGQGVIDLVAAIKRITPREAGLLLQEWFN